jgi:hypothetical protein
LVNHGGLSGAFFYVHESRWPALDGRRAE